VLVSHDVQSVRALCERTLVLHRGQLVFDGPTDRAVERYTELIHGDRDPREAQPEAGPQSRRTGDGRVRVVDVRMETPDGPIADVLPSGAPLRLSFDVEAVEDVVAEGGLTAGFSLRRGDMALYVYETRTSWRGTYLAPPRPGQRATLTFDVDANVVAGEYLIDLFVGSATSNVVHDRWQAAGTVKIAGELHDFGVAQLNTRVAIWNPDGVWPEEALPPPLDQGGPRHHPLRDG
jgi:hypothetical protein